MRLQRASRHCPGSPIAYDGPMCKLYRMAPNEHIERPFRAVAPDPGGWPALPAPGRSDGRCAATASPPGMPTPRRSGAMERRHAR